MAEPELVLIQNFALDGAPSAFSEACERIRDLSRVLGGQILAQTGPPSNPIDLTIDDSDNGGDEAQPTSGERQTQADEGPTFVPPIILNVSVEQDTFTFFKNWLRSSCRRLWSDTARPNLTFLALFKLYKFAQSYGIPDLGNLVVDRVRSAYLKQPTTLRPAPVRWLFRQCHEDSGMCALVADIYALTRPMPSWRYEHHPIGFYRKLSATQHIRRRSKMNMCGLKELNGCHEYHEHGDGARCPRQETAANAEAG